MTAYASATGDSGGSHTAGGAGGAGGTALSIAKATDHYGGTNNATAGAGATGGAGGAVTGTSAGTKTGGSGADVTSKATAIVAGTGTASASSTATGGAGGSALISGGTGGNGGNATAIAIAFGINATNATATAQATGAARGNGSSANGTGGAGNASATATGQKATANVFGQGAAGDAFAQANTSGGMVVSLTTSANTPVLTAIHQAVAKANVGLDNYGLMGAPGGAQCTAVAEGLPGATTANAVMSGRPIVRAAINPDQVLGLVGMGARHPGDGVSKTFAASAKFSLDLAHLASIRQLRVGLLDADPNSGFDSLHFQIIREGIVVLDVTFTDAAAAKAYFFDHVLDLGPINTALSGNLNLTFNLEMTADASFAGGELFWARFIFANAGPVECGPPRLLIVPAGPGLATISWEPPCPDFVLQESPTLTPPGWMNSSSGGANPVLVPTGPPMMFYRLIKP